MKSKKLDLLTANQKLQIEMMTLFAKHYSLALSESIKRGIRAKKEQKSFPLQRLD